jgi:Cu/Ag efflux protein CusF
VEVKRAHCRKGAAAGRAHAVAAHSAIWGRRDHPPGDDAELQEIAMQRRSALRALARAAWVPALAPGAALAQSDLASGEVVQVDLAARSVKIKHSGVPSQQMPPMIMVFHVRDLHMLDDLVTGDRVRFAVERIDGRYTITALSKAPAR